MTHKKNESLIILGRSEVSEVLKELDSASRLKGEIVVSAESLDELYSKADDQLLSKSVLLYTGGCEISEDEFVGLKEKTNKTVFVSISYSDMLLARKLEVDDISYTEFVKVRKGIYYPFIKRLGDILVSSIGIIVSSPIMLIVAILVRIKLGSPVTFSQIRPGRHEKIFRVHKFRSMTNAKDKDGNLLPDDQRITKFGSILRSTSLDELPQLFSIFLGKMSLIGPRPQSFENVYFMDAHQRLRHIVTPGLTGLSQVNGRNAIPWDEKIQYDLDYVNHKITFIQDFKIFFKTVEMVLLRKDITQEGSVSTESVGEFKMRTGQVCSEKYVQLLHDSRAWSKSIISEE